MTDRGRGISTVAGRIRLFVLVEALAFAGAASVHLGAFGNDYLHFAAGTAESVIGAVLILGLIASLLRGAWTRTAALVSQGFALLGTLVGLFTIAVGVGPRTVPDVLYHIMITALLAWGLVVALRARPPVRY